MNRQTCYIFMGLFSLLMFFEGKVFSQSKNVLKTNPFSIVHGQVPMTSEFQITFERTFLINFLSFQFGTSYISENLFLHEVNIMNANIHDFHAEGYRIMPAARVYLNFSAAPKGFYLSPMVSYAEVIFENPQNREDYLLANFYSHNLIGGFQSQLFGLLVIDIFAGIGQKTNEWYHNQPDDSIFTPFENETGIKYNLGLNIGINF